MILKVNIKEALRSLYGSKQRTILALIGIVIGIGSVIGMVSIGTIVEEEALRQFREMGTDILQIRKDFFFSGEQQNRKTVNQDFNLKIAMGLPHYVNKVVRVAPFSNNYSNLKYLGKKSSILF